MTTYSIGELKDLIAAKDYEIAQLGAHYGQFAPSWSTSDPATFIAWSNDWSALQDRYDSAKTSAQHYIDKVTVLAFDIGIDAIDATDEYTAILAAVNPSYAGNTSAPGSLGDLDARLTAASGSPTPYPNVPQPQYDTGVNPSSWEGYVTGLGYKLGIVQPGDVPAGTPGGPGSSDPPLVPGWAKVGLLAAAGLWAVAQLRDITR